jgi:hypothetical protein
LLKGHTPGPGKSAGVMRILLQDAAETLGG